MIDLKTVNRVVQKETLSDMDNNGNVKNGQWLTQ